MSKKLNGCYVHVAGGLAALVLLACAGAAQEPTTPHDPDPADLLADEPEAAAAPSGPEVAEAVEKIKEEDFQGAKAVLEPLAGGSDDPQLFYYLGVAQANTGEVDAATKSLSRALELQPNFTDASLNLAAFLLDLGRPDEALTAVEAGLKHAPGDPALLENKAFALMSRGDAAAAAHIYADLTKNRPNDEQLRFTYAQALADASKSEEAAQQLKMLKSSKDIAVLNSVADAFGRLHKYPDCIAAADAAIAIAQKSELYVRRGVCKGSNEDDAGAQADFKQATVADPSSATAHYYLGRSLSKKDKAAAKAAFKKAVELAGDNAKLKSAAENALAGLR